jgi:hypothetical protein
VGGFFEHVAAESVQIRDQAPMVQLPAYESADAIDSMHLRADLQQFIEGLGRLQALLLHQVHEGETHDHRPALPRVTVGIALRVAIWKLRTIDEVAWIPFRWRDVRVLGKFVQVRQEPRCHPSGRQEESDIDEVERVAFRGQRLRDPLVVGGEWRQPQIHLHAGLLLEFWNITLQDGKEVVLIGRSAQRHARKGL